MIPQIRKVSFTRSKVPVQGGQLFRATVRGDSELQEVSILWLHAFQDVSSITKQGKRAQGRVKSALLGFYPEAAGTSRNVGLVLVRWPQHISKRDWKLYGKNDLSLYLCLLPPPENYVSILLKWFHVLIAKYYCDSKIKTMWKG